MKFALKPTNPAKWDVDCLLLFCWEGEECTIPDGSPELRNSILETARREEYTGKEGQTLVIPANRFVSAYKLVIVGIGKQKGWDVFRLQRNVAAAVKKVRQEMRPTTLGMIIPREWVDGIGTEFRDRISSIVEAASLASYQFLAYKGTDEPLQGKKIDEVFLWVPGGKIAAAEQGITRGILAAEAVTLARDLVNEPSHVTTPTYLAQVAMSIAKQSKGAIKVDIMEQEDIKKLGLRAFLGVAQGSEEPPKFIRLAYKGAVRKKKVVLVGKGITFDSGGLSLKHADFMETMKLDMAGAATVLAVFQALAQRKHDLEVIGYIASCENMPSGKALKPGDILKAYNGKTIEVLNTDAEGRLTLADVLSYAIKKDDPDCIIDLATLTGACMVGLGADIAGMWSNDAALGAALVQSAGLSGEKIWHMPLESEYRDLIKSHIADVKNIQTGRWGGAITAALFLSEFVGDAQWAHFDIAGPSYNEKETALTPKGGTGFGVRLLLHFLSTLG